MIVLHLHGDMKHIIFLLLPLICLGTVRAAGKAYSNCTFPPLCRDRPPSAPRPEDEAYHVPREPCSCHHTCHLYDNCCSDAPGHVFSRTERKILGRTDGDAWTCGYLIPLSVDPDSKPVFMVDWCPSGTNDLLHAKCAKDPSIALFNYSYLLDVPVLSSNSGLIYQNVFCGTCHNEQYYRAFDYDLSCDCEVTAIEEVHSLLYEVGNLTWRGPRPQNIRCIDPDTITCNLHVNFDHEIGQRCEQNLVDSCSDGGMFKSYLNEGCVNGTNYYLQDRESSVYKNINCSMCNDKSLNEVICLLPDEYSSSTGVFGSDLWTISDLFSFDDHCDLNHVDDPVFGQCDNYVNIPDEILNGTVGNDTGKNTSIIQPGLTQPSTASVFFVVMMAISIVFLLLHIILFLILFKDRNLHSTNLFSMTCALSLAQIFFVFGPNLCATHQSCYILTILVYYFYIAAFLWMNVMSVDICKTFHSQSIHSHKGRTFMRYSLYAWGLALLLTIFALMVDNFASNSAVSPRFAERGFWFGGIGGMLMFFVIPVEILFAFNTALLLASVKEIHKQKKMGKFASASATSIKKLSKERAKENSHDNDEARKIYKLITGKAKKTLSDHKDQVAKLRLYGCLVVLMGVPWIFSVLVNFSIVFEYLFNFFNPLQGVFVFFAFDCNRKVWASLKAVCSSKKPSAAYSMSKSTESDQLSVSSSRSNSTGRGNKSSNKRRGQSVASKTTVDTVISQEPEFDVDGRNDAYKKENEVKRTHVELEVYDIEELDMDTDERKPSYHNGASRTISLSSSDIVSQDLSVISYKEATSMGRQLSEDSDRNAILHDASTTRKLPASIHSQGIGSTQKDFSTIRHEEPVETSPAFRSSSFPIRNVARPDKTLSVGGYRNSRPGENADVNWYNNGRQGDNTVVGQYSDSSDERFEDATHPRPQRSRRKRRTRKKRDRSETNAGVPQNWKMNYSMKRAIISSEEEDIIDV